MFLRAVSEPAAELPAGEGCSMDWLCSQPGSTGLTVCYEQHPAQRQVGCEARKGGSLDFTHQMALSAFNVFGVPENDLGLLHGRFLACCSVLCCCPAGFAVRTLSFLNSVVSMDGIGTHF